MHARQMKRQKRLLIFYTIAVVFCSELLPLKGPSVNIHELNVNVHPLILDKSTSDEWVAVLTLVKSFLKLHDC